MGGFEIIGQENGQTTFLGRNAGSWFKILVFYLFYYTFLFFLAWGSIQIRQNMISTTDVDGKTLGVKTPMINTRLSQVGIKVWPHHQSQGASDDNNLKLQLDKWMELDGRPKNNKYADYMEYFFLGTTTNPDKENIGHLHIGDPVIKPYCKSKSDCRLTQLISADFTTDETLRQKYKLDFIEFDEKNNTKINWKKFRAIVVSDKNKETGVIDKPLVFLTINKKIGFEFFEIFEMSADEVKGPLPVYNRTKFLETEKMTKKERSRAWFSCFSKDNDAARSGLLKYDVRSRKCEGDDAEATKTCKANREKYSSLQAILPFIRYREYKYDGYTSGASNQIKTDNKNSMNYMSPFAIFQVTIYSENNKIRDPTKFPLRCNALLRNIEYPYMVGGVSKLEDNQLLKQSGNGYTEFGFIYDGKDYL